MPCFKEKVNVGLAFTAVTSTAAGAVFTVEAIILAIAATGAFIASFGAFIVTLADLGTCMENAGRPSEAEKLRQQVAQMQRDLEKLKQAVGQ